MNPHLFSNAVVRAAAAPMRTYENLVELARMCARRAWLSSTPQVAGLGFFPWRGDCPPARWCNSFKNFSRTYCDSGLSGPFEQCVGPGWADQQPGLFHGVSQEVRSNHPSNRSGGRRFGFCSDDRPMSEVRHDHGSVGYYTTSDCCSHGEAHVPLCQMQSN